MPLSIRLVSADSVQPLRERFRQEAGGQIVHDSIHRRRGWTDTYAFEIDGIVAGFAGVAVGGPWHGKPTVFEMYLLPEYGGLAFESFETFLTTSAARFFEVQTSNELLTVMLHTFGTDIASEKIVFRDGPTTTLPAHGATLKRVTSEHESRLCFESRDGGSEWALEHGGRIVATGGILFHYNHPYGDIYMDVAEDCRQRGFGAYLVQELKKVTYDMGGLPAARCNPDNIASRRTLQKAGLVPYAHILVGRIVPAV